MKDEETVIGEAAGMVWHKLNETGSIIVPILARKLNLGVEETTLAVGWLLREGKVYIERKNCLLYIKNKY